MGKEFHIYREFDLKTIKDSSSPDDEWLGTVKGLAATTHKDLQEDILTRNFIKGTTKDLTENTTVFFNHKSDENPIAKILTAKTKRLEEKTPDEMLHEKDTHHYGTEITVGFSRTAETQWQLVKEGILYEFSIGGFLYDYEYDEEKDAFIVDSGLIKEVSVVGIAAQEKATITDVFKQLRKDLQSKQKVKNMEKDEVKDLFKDMLAKALAEQKVEFDADIVAQETLDAQKSQHDSLKAEVEKYEAKVAEIAAKNKELEDALAKKGRKTGKSHAPTEDVFYIDDEKMALFKGLNEFGKILGSGEPFKLELIPSTMQGRFTNLKI